MSVENNVPAIRFKGFGGEWEESALDVIAEVLDGDRGHNYPNGDDLQATGHTLFLSASNVTANGFKLDVTQYINEEKSNCMGNGKLILDDIILTSRGSVGHIAWYNECIKQQVPFARINSGMLILRPKNNIAPSIVAQFLKSPAGKKKIDLISFGSAQPQLTKMSISAYTVTIPSEKTEQTKIGNYFQQLDTLIAQHQQKHDKLLNLKKALLEKMFPKQGATVPEIRFKGFSGEWVGIALDDIGNATSGTSIESEFSDNGKYRVVSIGSYSEESVYTDQGIRVSLSEKTKFKILNKDDLTMILNDKTSSGNIIGRVLLIKENDAFVYNQRTQRIEPYRGKYDSQFLYQLLNAPLIREKIIKQSQGNTQIYVNWSAIKKLNYLTPELVEQTKIGNLFKQLDTLINQHQAQLKKLNHIKQACLEKMFV